MYPWSSFECVKHAWESSEMHSSVPVYVVVLKADHPALQASLPHNHAPFRTFYTLTLHVTTTGRNVEHKDPCTQRNIVTCNEQATNNEKRLLHTAFPDRLKRSHASRPTYPHQSSQSTLPTIGI